MGKYIGDCLRLSLTLVACLSLCGIARAQSTLDGNRIPEIGSEVIGFGKALPDQVRLPKELRALSKEMVGRAQRTQKEVATCLKLEAGSGLWTNTPLVEGTEKTAPGAGDCEKGADGHIHTHPLELSGDALPSSTDITHFIAHGKRFGLVFHKESACVLVTVDDDTLKRTTKDKLIHYLRYSLAAASHSESYKSILDKGQAGARLAKNHGKALYCGLVSGPLARVSGPDYPTDETDILLVKALRIMYRIDDANSGLPPINFKFTPELDRKFLSHANADQSPRDYLGKHDIDDLLLKTFAKVDQDRIGYQNILTMPDVALYDLSDGYLTFYCGRSLDRKLICRLQSVHRENNKAIDGVTLAEYNEARGHFIVTYPGLTRNNYKDFPVDAVGTGYFEFPKFVFEGPMQKGLPSGEGVVFVKDDGSRRRCKAGIENGVVNFSNCVTLSQ